MKKIWVHQSCAFCIDPKESHAHNNDICGKSIVPYSSIKIQNNVPETTMEYVVMPPEKSRTKFERVELIMCYYIKQTKQEGPTKMVKMVPKPENHSSGELYFT